MNKFEEFNYYQILEVPVNASSFEIKRAYRNALEVYSDHSLLTYSLFSAEERGNILKKLEVAYNTLIDRTKRTIYDASLKDKSFNIDIQQDHKLSPAGPSGSNIMGLISEENRNCLTAGTASESKATSENIPSQTGADHSLIKKVRGSENRSHEKSLEIVDFHPTRSFWGQVSARMIVIISLLGLTLVALSAILDLFDLPSRYFLRLTQSESHLEATAKQPHVAKTDFWDRQNKVLEKPESLDEKALITMENMSSTEDLVEVYENIAPLANIRARPTVDSRIITILSRGEEIDVVGKDGEWTMLKLDSGSVGWIHQSLIRKRPTTTDSSEIAQ